MPRDVVALVSADDFVSAVRVYADRVNDLLRRRGVPPLEAIEICETHALALLDAVINAPETVIDLAGWWFARAIEVTSASPVTASAGDEAVSMLAGTEGELQVREALSHLPDSQQAAVMLRDGYDLPPQAVGVALRRGSETATELTAAGRLGLVAAYDGRTPPTLAGHSGRVTVDLPTMSRLAEGSLEAPRAAPLRRHLSNCRACEEVVEALARGRRLAAGLPIIAMDDDARESLIDRIAAKSVALLPSHETVLRVVDEDHDPGPVVSPVVAIIALVLALSLGIGLAVISRSGNHTPSGLSAGSQTPLPPPPTAALSTSPSPHRHKTSPSLSPTLTTSATATTSESPSATPTVSTSANPPVTYHPVIVLSPTSGRGGTTITVVGAGWPPGTTALIRYAGQPAGSAVVDKDGNFHGQATANSLVPGQRKVVVHDGKYSATATFQQHL